MNAKPRVIIVGAGPAGLGAADVLCKMGFHVIVIDEGFQPGGQYLKRPAPGCFRPGTGDSLYSLGLHMVDRRTAGVTFLTEMQVVGAEECGSLWVETREGRLTEMKGDAVVFATGAREKFSPFKGWNLPGVISTGATQLLVKTTGVIPARSLVVAGCGPLPASVAAEVSAAGGRISMLLDQSRLLNHGRFFFRLAAYPSKFVEAWKKLLRLAVSGVPVNTGAAVIEARGEGFVQEVVTARLDSLGRFIPGTEKVLRTGCLAFGQGFAANVELPLAAGCRPAFDSASRGWVVEVDECMRTSIPGMYAAGEITSVAGVRKSFIEGRIAGLAIAGDTGFRDLRHDRLRADLTRERDREKKFGRLLGEICTPPAGLLNNLSGDTIVCRCEKVTAGEIRRSLATGARTPSGIKRATRCGMGICQGRSCGPILDDILSSQGFDPLLPLPARMPVKPVRVSSFLERP